MSSRKLSVLAGMFCFGASQSIMATNHQDEIVVTANRSEQTIDTILAPVTLIDRDRIERSQASSLYDLLKSVVGIQITRNGGRASTTNLYIRGTNDNHTLVLIDGVRAGSATLGKTPLEVISLDQVERIEIVRGPRSALYGSDAIGGVIQIFTRSPEKGQTVLSAGMGSYNTHKLGLSTGLSYDKGSIGFSATRETSDGFDVLFSDDETTGDPAFDKDDDEYGLQDFSLKWSHRFSDSLNLTWSNLYSEDESQYDNAWVAALPYSDSRNIASSLVLDWDVSDHWAVALQAGFAEDSMERLDKLLSASEQQEAIETERYDYAVTNRIQLTDTQQMVAGVDYVTEQVEPDYPTDERDNLGVFANYAMQVKAFSFSIGARYDNSDTYDSQSTGDIAFGYAFSDELEVILSHGTGFKAPTFNDLFWPEDDGAVGNPDLLAEESKNTELQFRGDINERSYYEASLFYNEIENLIQWAESPSIIGPWGYPKWTPTNVSNARIRGVELGYHLTLEEWQFAFNSSYIEPKNRSTDEDLARRARMSGSVDVSRQGDGYAVGLTVTGKGARKGDEGAPGGYATVDLRFEKSFSKSLLAKLKFDNLFNRRFVAVPGYNDAGRFVMLEVQYTIEH